MAQADRICIVPGCGQPCKSRERCNACLTYYRRNGHDAPLGVIDKRRIRDSARIDEAAIARQILDRIAH